MMRRRTGGEMSRIQEGDMFQPVEHRETSSSTDTTQRIPATANMKSFYAILALALSIGTMAAPMAEPEAEALPADYGR